MAEKITPNDFVRWTTEQIDPADVSALMSKYGYTDDAAKSILHAIEKKPKFRDEYGKLLRKSVAKRDAERKRSIGGVRMDNDSLTIEDWKDIVRQNAITRATGTNLNAGSGNENKKSFWDYFTTVLGVGGSVASSIWGKPQEQQQQQVQQSGSNTFLIVIVVVVLIAVVGVIWVSSSKK
jgi:cobalamin biosynthesis Mg chelatase CobN